MDLAVLNESQLDALARFMARENERPERHIPYVGTSAAGIAKEIRELPPLGVRGFMVGHRDGAIVAAMGIEADAEVGRVWLRGPFAPHEAWQETADQLLDAVMPLVPTDIGELELAADERNVEMARFAERHGFKAFGHSHLMELPRERLAPDTEPLAELPPELDDQLVALHDKAFPRTYYTARQLREMSGSPAPSGELRTLLGMHEGGKLKGYVFVEADPEVDSSDIHFIAVHRDARGKGIGRRLLRGALHWMFSHERITRVALVVRVDNPAAIGLYRAEGFAIVRTMLGWRRAREVSGV